MGKLTNPIILPTRHLFLPGFQVGVGENPGGHHPAEECTLLKGKRHLRFCLLHRNLWLRTVSSCASMAVPALCGGRPSKQGPRKRHGIFALPAGRGPGQPLSGLLLRHEVRPAAQPHQGAVANAESQPPAICCISSCPGHFPCRAGPLWEWE